ncbi:FAD-binding oxidoreductase [bacterium]|nr:FAD-binding oxidoreductase [bacterium]
MVHKHNSAWLAQVTDRHAHAGVETDAQREVVIVGGGISGVMTAYYLLKYTQVHVTLLEGDRVAHGATGHNAGQLAAEFEKTFLELVQQFGLEMAVRAEQDIERAWTLLETLYEEESLQTPLSTFPGYAGYESPDDTERILRNQHARAEAGLSPRRVYLLHTLADEARYAPYRRYFESITAEEIGNLLETNATHYRAVLARKRGCLNSALLCEELLQVLHKHYATRFVLHEHSHVSSVRIFAHHARLFVMNTAAKRHHVLDAARVVLCTNGFENISLLTERGSALETRFHDMVRGLVGSMVGYLEPVGKNPTALSFHDQSGTLTTKESGFDERAYFYFTRRPFEIDGSKHALVCVGGPEKVMSDARSYRPNEPFNPEHRRVLDTFMRTTYRNHADLHFRFAWHGLMGYTPSGMRIIGPDKKHQVLWYNLGCNGIGLMTAIFGGYKIAQCMKGETFLSSAFDPQ